MEIYRPRASIVICTHKFERNEPGNIENLLNKLNENLLGSGYEVIVVSNNNDLMPLLEGIRNRMSVPCRIINNGKNLGLPLAWDIGGRAANGNYIFFLNQDVILTRDDNIFAEMISRAEAYAVKVNKTLGIFGVEGSRWHEKNGIWRQYARYEAGQFHGEIEVELSGGFLFGMSREVFYRINGFDHELSPIFFEEMDFFFKMRELEAQSGEKFANIIISGINYAHKFGESAKNPFNSVIKWYKMHENDEIIEFLGEIHLRNKKYLENKWKIRLQSMI